MGDAASSNSDPSGRFTRTGHGVMDVRTYRKVPRLQSNHWVSCPGPDVRHPYHLSIVRNSREVSLLGILESHGSCGRNLPFCLVGQRLFFRSTPHLFGIVALCILLSGMYFFKRTERRVVDYL